MTRRETEHIWIQQEEKRFTLWSEPSSEQVDRVLVYRIPSIAGLKSLWIRHGALFVRARILRLCLSCEPFLWVVRCFIEATLEHSQAPGAYVQACALLPPRVDFGSRGRLHATAFRPSARQNEPL